MSNTVRLAVALALTAVTATSALAASRHRGVHPRAYSGYAYVRAYNAYRNLAPTLGYALRAYSGAYAWGYNPYPYLGP